jgi:hypothetical protein
MSRELFYIRVVNATAYQGIIGKRPRPPRPDSIENIRDAQNAIEEINGTQ